MRSSKYSDKLKKTLQKLYKKDKENYKKVINKIQEIINSKDVEHYKNLRSNLKDSKRVHIGHFVLIFQYDKNSDEINFDDFDHHDKIY